MDPAELIAAAALLARCEAASATYIERDKHQHRHVDDGSTRPPTFTPPEPPFTSNRSTLDAANQVVSARAALLPGHPAYLGSATQPLLFHA